MWIFVEVEGFGIDLPQIIYHVIICEVLVFQIWKSL